MQMYVNETYNIEDEANECYLHRDEKFVGVCPLCLNERLISLAYLSKRFLYCLHSRSFNLCSAGNSYFSSGDPDKKTVLQRIFSMGSGIFHHLHRKSGDFGGPGLDESLSTSSHEAESYIAIKIEENDFASWDKNNPKQVTKSVNDSNMVFEAESGKKSPREKKDVPNLEIPTPSPKPKPAKRLNWHDRFGCACHDIKKRGSMRGWVCRVRTEKVVEGVEIRKGGCWLRRTLTKRRTPKKE